MSPRKKLQSLHASIRLLPSVIPSIFCQTYLLLTGVPRDRFLHKTMLIITIATNVTAAITAITIHNVFSSEVRLLILLTSFTESKQICNFKPTEKLLSVFMLNLILKKMPKMFLVLNALQQNYVT